MVIIVSYLNIFSLTIHVILCLRESPRENAYITI